MVNKKSGVKKQNNFIKIPSIKRLMKNEGAKNISKEAVELIISALTEKAEFITKKAVQITKSEQRKRVSGEDIVKVTRLMIL